MSTISGMIMDGYLLFCRMVKQKHHTARNQSIKNHKNGIKKPLRQRGRCMKGVIRFLLI